MKKTFINFIRYSLFLPISFIAATFISGTFSVLQNILAKAFCAFAIFNPFGLCSDNNSERTFLAEIIFFVAFIQLSILIIPSHKKEAAYILSGLIGLSILLLEIFLLTKGFFNNVANMLIIALGLLVYSVAVFKNKILVDKEMK